MQHSIAARYAAWPARFVHPSARARERRLGLVPSPAFIAAPGRRTVLRRPDVGPLTALRAPWRALTIEPVRVQRERPARAGRAHAVDQLHPVGRIAPLLRGARVARLRQASATSAGGIVIRFTDGTPELVVGKRRRERDGVTWTLPKGTPGPGRDHRADGRPRGVRGDRARGPDRAPAATSSSTRSSWAGTRIHKTVHYFLMVPTGGDLSRHDHEFAEVRWIAFAEAATLLTFDTERALVARAAAEAIDGSFPAPA